MTINECKWYLHGVFSFWRVYESNSRILIKIADGPISTNQMFQLHENKPIGVVIHFQTYSWFVRKLFHYGILRNFKWITCKT